MSELASSPGNGATPDAPARVDETASPDADAPVVPPAPEVARSVFGPGLADAERYVARLATDGVTRGLIGPREVPRLWERHVLNSAAVADAVAPAARVVDVGSGAGLPGIPLALARPDIEVVLLEPLARRAVFLTECVRRLALPKVAVVRGRAEEGDVRRRLGGADVVTARAVAPLERLAGWCLPLLRPGGRLLALKGESAAEELAATGPALRRIGGSSAELVRCGAGTLAPPTTVVVVTRGTVRATARGGHAR